MNYNALRFEGINESGSKVAPAGLPLGNSPVSCCFWAKPTLVDGNYHGVVEYGVYAAGKMFDIIINTLDNKWMVSQHGAVVYGPVAVQDVWQWVLVTMATNGVANGDYSLYFNNGVPVTGTMATNRSNGTLYAGRDPGGAYFVGLVQDLRIFNRVITSAERSLIYNNGYGTLTPLGDEVSWFKFGETAGATATDSGSAGNHLTLSNMEDADWMEGYIRKPAGCASMMGVGR